MSPAALSLAPERSSTWVVIIPFVGSGRRICFTLRLLPTRSRDNRDVIVRTRLNHADVVVGHWRPACSARQRSAPL